jgi:class 3 adenylate cyclase/tetratricopeptide (TPR) repeat protein
MIVCARCGNKNPDRAKFCQECGAPLSPPVATAEERKLVTVLFADVAGSTRLGEMLDAEALKDVMNRFFAAMRAEIEAEGGTVEKFIGDAVMAAFGVPVAHEDDAARALRAALRMLRRLPDLNRDLAAEHGVELAIRIGVNTGQVMATMAPRPGEAMATGDPVNLAARLQQLAEPGAVLVGARTASAVRGFALAPFDQPLALRGKSEPVAAYVLTGERDEPQRGIPGLRAPLVGRDAELGLLSSVLRRVADERRGHLMTIYGDPGVGKSRLVAEFTGMADARVVRGRCLPYGDGITFWPLAEIAKSELGVLDTDDTATALAKVRMLGDAAPAIAHTIGLDDPQSPLLGLSPHAVIAQIHRAWLGFFARMAEHRPLIAVIEDIHWADGAMLDLLEALPDRVPAPVLFVCPSRPELTARRPGWGGGRRSASSVALDPLGAAEAQRMVHLLLDIDDLGEQLRGRILERAEGNPFFLEEIVRRLIDERLIIHDDGRWRALAGIDDVDIPDTVQGVLAARIDLLPAAEKRVVQSAAVVGRVFWPGAVAGLVNGDAEDVETLLDGLERRDLVLTRLTSAMAGERELIFKHILTRDVAYESLPRRDRPQAHQKVAEWIEQMFGERRLEVAELLAHHYDLAGCRALAYGYALDAARRDLSRLALDQALMLAGRAAELAETPAERAQALAVTGEARYQLAEGDAAYVVWREAADLLDAEPDADPAILAAVCGRMSMLATRAPGLMPNTRVSPDKCRRYLDIGLAAAGEDDSESLVDLLMAEAAWAFAYPDLPSDTAALGRMRDASRRAVEMAERLNRPELLSLALDVDQIANEQLDDVHAMVANAERRLQLADGVHAIIDLDDIFYMAAQVYWEQGRYDDARRVSEEGIERVRSLGGDPMGSLGTRAISQMLLGDWDAVLEEGERIRERFGDSPPGFLRVAWALMEFVLASRGRFAEAAALRPVHLRTRMRLAYRALGLAAEGRLDEAWAQFAEARLTFGVAFELLAKARLLQMAARWPELAELCDAIRERSARTDWRIGPAAADRGEAAVALAAGDGAGAVELLRRAVAGYAAAGVRWDVAVSQVELAEALAALGDTADIASLLAAAEPPLRSAGALAEIGRWEALAARFG